MVMPSTWWNTQKESFPRLFKVAMDLLPIPGSSVKSEEAFSHSGATVTKKRNSLDPESVQMVMCLRAWRKYFSQ